MAPNSARAYSNNGGVLFQLKKQMPTRCYQTSSWRVLSAWMPIGSQRRLGCGNLADPQSEQAGDRQDHRDDWILSVCGRQDVLGRDRILECRSLARGRWRTSAFKFSFRRCDQDRDLIANHSKNDWPPIAILFRTLMHNSSRYAPDF